MEFYEWNKAGAKQPEEAQNTGIEPEQPLNQTDLSENEIPAYDMTQPTQGFDPLDPVADVEPETDAQRFDDDGFSSEEVHDAPEDEPFGHAPTATARPAARSEQTQAGTDHVAETAEPVKQKKKSKTANVIGRRMIALSLCCALIGGAVGAGGVLAGQKLAQSREAEQQASSVSTMVQGQREHTSLNVVSVDTGKVLTPAQVYAANVNSTVGITTEINTNYWGYQTTAAAAGSGFILTEDGYILTNHHVIDDASTITVAMYDGTTYPAQLVGYDEGNDIAVLKIDATGLTPVVLGSSDDLNVGDSVLAIGNPLGELTFSLTAGTVSALDRQITLSSGVSMNLIQTDCAINSGNSGGALFNLYGEVVGITNAKYSSSGSTGEASIDNIGFAIPIDSVRTIVSSIIEKGYISKPYIGVSIEDVSAETQSFGLPQGAAVRGVVEDSPAAKAGLQQNDIITAVNGQTITGSSDLTKIVGDAKPGDELKLTIYRQGQTMELTVTVGERVQNALGEDNQSQQSQQQNGQQSQNPNGQYGQDPYGYGGQQGDQGQQGNPFGSFPWGWMFGG